MQKKIQGLVKTFSGLTNEVTGYANICSYNYHFGQIEIRDAVESLFSKYVCYLDTPEEKFSKKFYAGYGQKIYELVMAEFFSTRFSTIERTEDKKKKGGIPDIVVCIKGKKYYVECTSRSSCLLDKYIELLPDFERYYAVAKIIHEGYKLFKNRYSVNEQSKWYHTTIHTIQNILPLLNARDKELLYHKLKIKNHKNPISSNDIEEFQKWIDINRYALFHFKELLPKDIIEKLMKTDFNILYGWGSNEAKLFNDFLVKSIAQTIIDKLLKDCFLEEVPVIVSITLSLINDFKMFDGAENIIKNIADNLPSKLLNIAKEKCKNASEYERCTINIEKLYAVIIDTTWYNWFPDVVREKYCANFPTGHNNCYGVIYNKNISELIKNNSNTEVLNEFIPFRYPLELKIE